MITRLMLWEYQRLKRAYHTAGKRAKGKETGTDEQLAYEEAKHRYHRAGEELRRERTKRG